MLLRLFKYFTASSIIVISDLTEVIVLNPELVAAPERLAPVDFDLVFDEIFTFSNILMYIDYV